MEDENPLFSKNSTSSIDEGWFCSKCNTNNNYNDIRCFKCNNERNYLQKNQNPPNSRVNVDFLNDIPTVKSIQVKKFDNLINNNIKNSIEGSLIENEKNDNKNIWKCPNCQKEGNDSNFCPNCGTKKP